MKNIVKRYVGFIIGQCIIAFSLACATVRGIDIIQIVNCGNMSKIFEEQYKIWRLN